MYLLFGAGGRSVSLCAEKNSCPWSLFTGKSLFQFRATSSGFCTHVWFIENVTLASLCLLLTQLALLSFRLLSEDEGMDIPFEEGMLSPTAADMRPGERVFIPFFQWYPTTKHVHYSVREP